MNSLLPPYMSYVKAQFWSLYLFPLQRYIHMYYQVNRCEDYKKSSTWLMSWFDASFCRTNVGEHLQQMEGKNWNALNLGQWKVERMLSLVRSKDYWFPHLKKRKDHHFTFGGPWDTMTFCQNVILLRLSIDHGTTDTPKVRLISQ